MTDPDFDEQNETLMELSERMLIVVEWAEGQRKMLMERGWPEECAHAWATELLIGSTRLMWASAAARAGL